MLDPLLMSVLRGGGDPVNIVVRVAVSDTVVEEVAEPPQMQKRSPLPGMSCTDGPVADYQDTWG